MKLNVRSNAKIIPFCGNIVHFGGGNIHFKKSWMKDFAKKKQKGSESRVRPPAPPPLAKPGFKSAYLN